MTDDRPPTIGESYGRATESSDLRIRPGRSDADLLIAAGWLDGVLGALLFRLAREWDGVKGEQGIARAEFDRMERLARELDRTVFPAGEKPGPKRAEEMRNLAARAALTARLLMLGRIKSLGRVKRALCVFARWHAERRVIEITDDIIAALVGQALDIHLDATCGRCQGRGVNGGYGSQPIVCRPCRGSGKRDAGHLGEDRLQREFGAFLLESMRRMLGRAAGGIKRAVRGEETVTATERASSALRVRATLDELRSVDAAMD